MIQQANGSAAFSLGAPEDVHRRHDGQTHVLQAVQQQDHLAQPPSPGYYHQGFSFNYQPFHHHHHLEPLSPVETTSTSFPAVVQGFLNGGPSSPAAAQGQISPSARNWVR
jgi:hypothetical protein